MKAGDRVLLNEDMCELSKGLTGIVVTYQEKPPYVQFESNVLAVLFDGEKFPCAGRTINDVYMTVISKCVLI